MNKPLKFFKSVKPETIALRPKSLKFPSISLTIPEGIGRIVLNPVFLTAFLCGFLVMAIGIVGNEVKSNLTQLQIVKQDRLAVETQLLYWKNVAEQYADYRDALYQLAILEYRLGETQVASDYLKQTLAIDPGFKEAKQLLEMVVKN